MARPDENAAGNPGRRASFDVAYFYPLELRSEADQARDPRWPAKAGRAWAITVKKKHAIMHEFPPSLRLA